MRLLDQDSQVHARTARPRSRMRGFTGAESAVRLAGNRLAAIGLWLACLAIAVWGADQSAAAPLSYNVTDYGAVGDGRTAATSAIQKAVDTCAVAGGGQVLIPAGRYLTGPIFLKSGVAVEIEAGAVVLGSTNFGDYAAIDGRWEGIERKVYASMFTGFGLHQVSITGRGILDGQGAGWWDANRKTMALRKKKRLREREPENPPEAPLRWPRPRMINLYHCTNVLIRDITILNSPSWNVHPVYCEDVTLDNVTITAPAHGAPNTDAVDPDSCRNVRISNCRFDVGDDCIAIKSGYNEDGRRVGIPCENILVTNCTFAHGHGGVTIGSEMSGSVRNITVEDCVFDGTQRGLRVKTALGRGGVIEYFRATNLVMRNISDTAFSITADYGKSAAVPNTSDAVESIPRMRHFSWAKATLVNTKRVADLRGLPGSPLEDFRLSNVQSTGAKAGMRCEDAAHVVLEDITLQPSGGPALEVRNVKDLDVSRLTVQKPNDGAPVVLLQAVSSALVHGCTVTAGPGAFLRCAGDANENIRLEGNHLAAGLKERGP